MTEVEVLEEQKKFELLRVMRKEQYTWNAWKQDQNTLMILPSLWKEQGYIDLTQYSTIVGKFLETTHYFLPDQEALKILLNNPLNGVPINEIAFAYFKNEDVGAPTERPDYKYELYSLIKALDPRRCRLWTLNPINKKVEFTDTAPLYVALGLY
jgi:hypothetical protein